MYLVGQMLMPSCKTTGIIVVSGKHTIFRLDAHYSQPYLCAVTFNNNDYGKRKSKLSGGI